jgi:hypothetical protein
MLQFPLLMLQNRQRASAGRVRLPHASFDLGS